MELDEFKQLYQQKAKASTDTRSALELEQFLRSRARSITARIKRSIVFEFTVTILFMGVAIWVGLFYPSVLAKPFSILTLVLCLFFFFSLGVLYKKIQQYETSSPSVKDKLVEVITILQQFTRLYFQFTMVTLPIIFVFGLITGYLQVTGNPRIQSFNWHTGIVLYSGLFLLWWIAMYFFTKWYIKKLYGNYLEQLRQQLKDIENG